MKRWIKEYSEKQFLITEVRTVKLPRCLAVNTPCNSHTIANKQRWKWASPACTDKSHSITRLSKENRHKKWHTVCFHLYEVQRQANLNLRSHRPRRVPPFGEQREGSVNRRDRTGASRPLAMFSFLTSVVATRYHRVEVIKLYILVFSTFLYGFNI